MKKTNSIRIFSILFVLLVVAAYRFGYPKFMEDQAPLEDIETETEIQEATEQEVNVLFKADANTPEDVTESAILKQPYKYVIVEEDGYLTVYEADLDTVYTYTDIAYSELEDALKEKVKHGMKIENLAQLYNFLENYSS